MTPESSPFDSAIAELESRIKGMQIALETLRQLRSQHDGVSPAGTSMGPRPGETEVQHDSFFGLTIAEAAKKYLNMVKRTKPTSEIAAALESGGLKHASKSFQTTIRSVLGQKEDFLRVNGEWGLTEWYPGMGRGRKAKPENGEKARAMKPYKPRASTSLTRKERILRAMASDPAKGWTANDIAKAIGDERKYVQLTLILLAKEKKVVKSLLGYSLSAGQAA